MGFHGELAELDAASASLLDGLKEPGIVGQKRLHARLEDIKQLLTEVRESAGTLSAPERLAAREALRRCAGNLSRTDRVLHFIGDLIERQVATGACGDDYAVGGQFGRTRSGQLLHCGGSLEVEA